MKFLEAIGGRKFLLAVLILVAGLVLVLTGQITYQEFLNLAKWMMGLFVSGNVVQKFSGLVKK